MMETLIKQLGNMQKRIDEIEELLTRDYIDHISARVYRSTNQSIPNATNTPINFDGVLSDTGGFWDVGNPTRLTLSFPGLYIAIANATFATNSNGDLRQIGIRSGGSALLSLQSVSPLATNTVKISTSTLLYLSSGTGYIELIAYQDSGGPLSIGTHLYYSPHLHICRIG
jgi:hypothetical protein